MTRSPRVPDPLDDSRVADWLAEQPDTAPALVLRTIEAALPSVPQRRTLRLLGRPAPVGRVLAVAAVIATLVAGVVGSRLLAEPTPVVPSPSAVVPPTPSFGPSAAPVATSAPPAPPRLVAFQRIETIPAGTGSCPPKLGDCYTFHQMLARGDGSGTRELGDTFAARGWTPDGSRLLVLTGDAATGETFYALLDPAGGAPERLDLACARPCQPDGDGDLVISPDGTRMAFTRLLETDLRVPRSVVAIVDRASGKVTVLESTTSHVTAYPKLGGPCAEGCDDGTNTAIGWSPDGRQLVFSRSGYRDTPPTGRPEAAKTALFIVDADGADLRHLVPVALAGRDGRWSPDGSRIAFTSAVETLIADPPTDVVDLVHTESDVVTVRPDGSDIRRLTDDHRSHVEGWTRDGRIVFTRITLDEGNGPTAWELWVMDPDGDNETRVRPVDIPTLTALGCMVCPLPQADPPDVSVWLPELAYWQPGG